ncbi:hypothetical protein LA324_05240 [Corynebacterium coyleae]|uniref:hypothetical protein n=1 Tax=Corynebacterium coyleae TaxID=53374 RepID=UPI001CCCB69F|nr:hypothetical protein [Corynebacterium coyleae]UBI10015.1 hypothetical protein LA324_05240 [Corynebacterium coyleae]
MAPEMGHKQKLRSWALSITQGTEEVDDLTLAAAEFIKEAIPALTMKDIKWDDDKHSLGIARAPGKRVVMLSKPWSGKSIKCLVLGSYNEEYIPVEDLTPTGEKIVVQTVDE